MSLNFKSGRVLLGTEFAGWTFNIYEPDGSTPKKTYQEQALSTENDATITLDIYGGAQIWFDGNAKSVFKNKAGSEIYSDDDINVETASTSTGEANLIINPSFEDDIDADGTPDGFTLTLYSGGAFTLNTADQYNGSTSAKFTSVGTGGGYLTSTSFYAVSPSIRYTSGFAIKSSAADVRNTVVILWYQADQTASSTASTSIYDDSATNPTSWAEKFKEIKSPSDAAFAKIRLTGCHSSDATSGNTQFDQVIFTGYVYKRPTPIFRYRVFN